MTKEVVGGIRSGKEKRKRVIQRFCKLSAKVQAYLEYNCAADCFCGERKFNDLTFTFEEDIFKFIEGAVDEKMEREKENTDEEIM